MKHLLLSFFFAIIALSSHSQRFSKGYFINNSNEKIECLIRNPGFKNPNSINYKLTETAPQVKAAIDSIKEFGIYDESKYIRSVVKIDRSSMDIKSMSIDPNPEFTEEQLFLKMLVEGKASLYVYEEPGLIRFFYQVEDSPIEQLVYKEYKTHGGQIGKNIAFQQQIANSLQCHSFTFQTFSEITYETKALVDVFSKYNDCISSNYTNWREKRRRGTFNITFRPGLNNTMLSVSNSSANNQDVDFGRKLSFRQGVEFEFVLPYKDRSWSICIEPTFQQFVSEKPMELTSAILNRDYTVSVDYKSIDLPITLRRYFELNNNSKLFVNASIIGDVLFPSSINYERNGAELYGPLKISTGFNFAFGVGIQHSRYRLEYRHHTNRHILEKYQSWSTNYKTFSIVFGYKILSKKL